MRGFIFTMDAVFALTLATFAVSILLYAHFASSVTYQAPIKTSRSAIDTLLQIKTGQVVPQSPVYIRNGGMQLPGINPTGYAVFNGENSKLNVSETYSGGVTTVSAWVYPETFGNNMTIVSAGWDFGISPSGNLAFYSGDGIGNVIVGALTNDTWNMVTLSLSGSTDPIVSVYINGVLESSVPMIGSLQTGKAYRIGYDPYSSNGNLEWTGYISNVQVYDSNIYSDQIEANYYNGQSGLPIASHALAVWLPLYGSVSDHSTSLALTTATNVSFGYNAYSSVGFNFVNNNDSLLTSLAFLYLNGHAAAADAVMRQLNLTDTAVFLNSTYAPGSYVAHFDGVNSIITVKNTSLSINQQFTISLWMNKSAYSTTCESVVGMPSSSQLLIFSPTVNGCSAGSQDGTSPTFKYKGYNGFVDQLGFASNLPSNEWENLAAVMDGNVLTLYVNGKQTAQYTGLNHTSIDNKTLNIGFGDSYFNGSIADLQVYNTSLTSSNITELYSSGLAGGPVSYRYLVGWWPLLGTPNDYSGNGNVGFANSGVSYVGSGYEPESLTSAYQISKSTMPLPLVGGNGDVYIYNVSVVTWR